MIRDKRKRLLGCERERRQRRDHAVTAAGVGDDRVLRAVIHLDALHAGDGAQIILQNIRLTQRHGAARKVHPQPPGRLVENETFHRLA